MQYIESVGTDYKMKCKEDAPEEIRKALEGRIKSFNDWVDEMNGEKGDEP